MARKSNVLTIGDIEELLDRKFDEKLKPIKDELAEVKYVLEHKVYKEMKEMKKEMKEGFDRLENINVANIQDHDDLEVRVKRLEKNSRVS